jgi:hypothetical protein
LSCYVMAVFSSNPFSCYVMAVYWNSLMTYYYSNKLSEHDQHIYNANYNFPGWSFSVCILVSFNNDKIEILVLNTPNHKDTLNVSENNGYYLLFLKSCTI